MRSWLGRFLPERVAGVPADDAMRVGGDFRRGRLAGADRPDRLVGDQDLGKLLRRSSRRCRPGNDRASTASVWPASRCSSVSPTQTIGVSPASSAAMVFLQHGLVRLTEILAALAVADDHVRAADGCGSSGRTLLRCTRLPWPRTGSARRCRRACPCAAATAAGRFGNGGQITISQCSERSTSAVETFRRKRWSRRRSCTSSNCPP